MSFHNPLYLLLLLLVPLFVYLRRVSSGEAAIGYSSAHLFSGIRSGWRAYWAQKLPWLTIGAFILLVLALARPQFGVSETIVRREGVDIILALDVSTSMLAEDFQLNVGRSNRLDVVKKVTREFIRSRPNDRIGIVIFAGRPYILSPLTWDHDWTETRISEIEAGMIEDGTAIGTALTTAVSRLHESKAHSKVVVLLTDGNNNAGEVAPETAAAAAKALGVTVHTIGAGSKGLVPYPARDPLGRTVYQNVRIDLDENLLQRIAATTGGRYFRATDTETLREIFRRIDRMEKTRIEAPRYRDYVDLYPWLLGFGLLLLTVETLLANTVFRRLP
jgi:Ca-activated chloride channel family protein